MREGLLFECTSEADEGSRAERRERTRAAGLKCIVRKRLRPNEARPKEAHPKVAHPNEAASERGSSEGGRVRRTDISALPEFANFCTADSRCIIGCRLTLWN